MSVQQAPLSPFFRAFDFSFGAWGVSPPPSWLLFSFSSDRRSWILSRLVFETSVPYLDCWLFFGKSPPALLRFFPSFF